MKSYVFMLTDEAQAEPERFLPAIKQSLTAKGCSNLQVLSEIGCITADFPDKVHYHTFLPLDGINSVELGVEATTQV